MALSPRANAPGVDTAAQTTRPPRPPRPSPGRPRPSRWTGQQQTARCRLLVRGSGSEPTRTRTAAQPTARDGPVRPSWVTGPVPGPSARGHGIPFCSLLRWHAGLLWLLMSLSRDKCRSPKPTQGEAEDRCHPPAGPETKPGFQNLPTRKQTAAWADATQHLVGHASCTWARWRLTEREGRGPLAAHAPRQPQAGGAGWPVVQGRTRHRGL